MNIDATLLAQFLKLVVEGGLAGVGAFFLMEKVRLLVGLNSDVKRYVSLAITATLGMLAFGAAVGLSYQPQPASAQAWLEALFAVAFISTNTSQVIHGYAKLRK